MNLAAILPLTIIALAQEESDPTPGAGDELAVLRRDLGGTLNLLASPCVYDLEVSQFLLDSDSPLGLELLALIEGQASVDANSFSVYTTRLEKLAVEPDLAQVGLTRATGAQCFHLDVGSTRTVQWCTSDPDYPSILRTRDLEIAYFQSESRLDFQEHTRGSVLFTPRLLISPLPSSPDQLDRFISAPWKLGEDVGAGLRVAAISKEGGAEWLSVDVGVAPGRLPFGCTWYPDGKGSRGGFTAVYHWEMRDGVVVLGGILHIADEGKRFDISLYRLQDVRYQCRDADIHLPLKGVRKIRDLTGDRLVIWKDMDSIPAEWRALLQPSDQSPARKGATGRGK